MNAEITEQNFVDFKCPHCGELNSFPENSIGNVRECFNCMAALIVPKPPAETGNPIPLPIKTTRLIVRPPELQDLEDFLKFEFGGDEDQGRHWLETQRKTKFAATDQWFYLAVESTLNQRVIGAL